MEAPLEIRYAGVVIGRAQEVRNAEGETPSFFLVVRDPMPVGTVLHLRTGDHETPARVVHAVESSDPSLCGMQVRIIGEAEEVAPEFIPPPAVLVEKVKPAIPSSAVEVDVKGVGADSSPAAAPDPAPAQVVSESRDTAPMPSEPDAEAAPAPASPSDETSAIPEAVPVAIESPKTDALENATVSDGVPTQIAEGAQVSTPSNEDSSAAETHQATEELPPARPIEPSGRRKTKRRR